LQRLTIFSIIAPFSAGLGLAFWAFWDIGRLLSRMAAKNQGR